MDNNFQDDELIYRGIDKEVWLPDKKRPSSSAFKHDKGVSVNRGNFRPDNECIADLITQDRIFCAAKLDVKAIKSINVHLVYDPIENNIYHSELHNSSTEIRISASKARKLAKAFKPIL